MSDTTTEFPSADDIFDAELVLSKITDKTASNFREKFTREEMVEHCRKLHAIIYVRSILLSLVK